MRYTLTTLCIVGIIISFTCCTQRKKIKIGFSQCTGGEWREQMNQQMRSEINFYDNVDLEIRNASGKLDTQIDDINYFINQGVDLLIISPLEDKALADEFNKIDFRNIPILLVDRNISSNKHISFVGASNVAVGEVAAQYTLAHIDLKKHVKILHIRGYEKSSATEDREMGFVNALRAYPNVEIVTLNSGKDLDGKLLNETRKIIYANKKLLEDVDVVYGFNDEMCLIAVEAVEQMNLKHKVTFIGVDGQIGYGKGIDAVRKNKLQATIVYPQGGETAIETGMKIINKTPVQKNISLPITLVDANNVESYYQQEIYIQDYQNKIELLENKTKAQAASMKKQQFAFVSIFVSSFLLIVLISCFIYRCKCVPKRKLEKTKLSCDDAVDFENEDDPENTIHSIGLENFKHKVDELLEKNYSNHNFSVTSLVNSLSLSRMHLYRKFKLAFNDTPNNYIRKYRLEKAIELLHKGEMNFSEITYEVGFTSPAYFTKCFKEIYSCTPSEYIENGHTFKRS